METRLRNRADGQQRADQRWRRPLLKLAGVGLLWASAGTHLDLYLTGYRTIPTIGPLFLFQVIVGLLLGLLILVTPSRLIAALGALFALSTLGGYLLSLQFSLFGFREVRTTAGIVAGILEVLAFAALAIYALTPHGGVLATAWARFQGRLNREGTGAHDGGPSRRRLPSLSMPQAALVAGVISLVAVGLFAGALSAAGTSGAPSGSGTPVSGSELRTTQINGVTVLTNSQGRTLYWFAPDTPTKSVCNGSCAAYWPPVKGPATAGAGVTGNLGTVTRADGSTEATYNGHPLYTYIGDSGPGQAHGNNLNLNGGLWHEVVVTK